MAKIPHLLPALLSVAFFFSLVPDVQARLGESEAVCVQRYGVPVKVEEKDSGRNLWFKTGLFEMAVSFRDNRAVRIAYRLVTGEPISVKRIDEVLRDNGKKENEALGTARLWYFQPMASGRQVVFMEEEKGMTRAEYDIATKVLVVEERRRD